MINVNNLTFVVLFLVLLNPIPGWSTPPRKNDNTTPTSPEKVPKKLRMISEMSEEERLSLLEPFDYKTDRTFLDYEKMLSEIPETMRLANFLKAKEQEAAKNGTTLTLLDSGAGSASFQRHVVKESCANIEAVSFAKFIPKNFLDDILQATKTFSEGSKRFRYFPAGTEEGVLTDLQGKVDLITDIHGALSYSHDPGKLLEYYGSYLKEGGKAYIYAANSKFSILDESEDKKGEVICNTLGVADLLGSRKSKGFDTEVFGLRSNALILTRNSEKLQIPPLTFIAEKATVLPPPLKVFRLETGKPSRCALVDADDGRSFVPIDGEGGLRWACDKQYRLSQKILKAEKELEERENELTLVETELSKIPKEQLSKENSNKLRYANERVATKKKVIESFKKQINPDISFISEEELRAAGLRGTCVKDSKESINFRPYD